MFSLRVDSPVATCAASAGAIGAKAAASATEATAVGSIDVTGTTAATAVESAAVATRGAATAADAAGTACFLAFALDLDAATAATGGAAAAAIATTGDFLPILRFTILGRVQESISICAGNDRLTVPADGVQIQTLSHS